MPEHDQPGEEDQGFTPMDLGSGGNGPKDPEGGTSEEFEDDERSPAEKMRSFESLMEHGDLRDITGKAEFWDLLIEGDGKGSDETIQTRLEEDKFPPEFVEAVKSQRKLWEDAREATQRNLDIIKKALEQHKG